MARLWLLAGLAFPLASLAQDPAEALSRANRAYAQGSFQEAATLLSYVLNPELRLPDSVWVPALHRLAHSLLEIGRGDLAGVWLRWALRHRGRIRLDDVNFPPAVMRAFADAGRAVQQSFSRDTLKLVATRWRWPDKPQELFALGGLVAVTPLAEGEENCRDSGLSAGLGALVDLGDLSLGQVRYLPPETYTLTRTGPRCREGWLEREVLPGVVTEVMEAGRLTIVSDAWLAVYLDGELIGVTRVAAARGRVKFTYGGRELEEVNNLPVTPGVRRIRLTGPQDPVAVVGDTTVTVLPGQRLVLDLASSRGRFADEPALSASPSGPLLYIAADPEAAVYLDGELIGVAPVSPPSAGQEARVGGRTVPFVWGQRVRAGSHVLSLRRTGYEPFDTVIVFGDEPRVELTVTLRRRDHEEAIQDLGSRNLALPAGREQYGNLLVWTPREPVSYRRRAGGRPAHRKGTGCDGVAALGDVDHGAYPP